MERPVNSRRHRLKSRLFYKIFGSYLVVVVLSLLIMGFFVSRQLESGLTRIIREDLSAQARLLALLPKGEIEKRMSVLAEISQSRVTLVDASGWVVVDSEKKAEGIENHLNRPEIQEARIKGQGEAIRYSHTLGVNMLYIVFPIREGAELKGYVRLARPLHNVKKSIDQLYQSIFNGILIITIASLIIVLIFSRKFVLPIQKVESFTGKVCRGEDPGTLLIESDDEIGRLARNINCMVLEHEEKIRYACVERGKVESAFASMIEGVIVLNGQSRIESMNKGMKDIITQQYPADFIGKTPLEAFRNLQLQNALERFNETKSPVSHEVCFGEDDLIVLIVSISAIHGLPGNEEKTMMVFHDITRLKKLERMREDFVANVTHEIKTPLTAIIGFIETLQDGAIEESRTAKTFLNTIAENAHRLDRLVDGLLTLSDIELGDMTLCLEGVSVSEVFDQVLPVVEAKIAEKKQTVYKTIPDGLPLILADRDRVAQILLNVIDNAVKFTPEGGKITVTAYEHGNDKDNVIVRINDTGVGIPKNELPRVGERFYRVDKTRSRELGGTGLGLSIVKHLMKAHLGRIDIDSKVGAGTSVSLYFPVYQRQKS
jgi:two-component system phosphate regulon sensor histidine kinase PhoR